MRMSWGETLLELGKELCRRRWELRIEKKGNGEETLTDDAVSGWPPR